MIRPCYNPGMKRPLIALAFLLAAVPVLRAQDDAPDAPQDIQSHEDQSPAPEGGDGGGEPSAPPEAAPADEKPADTAAEPNSDGAGEDNGTSVMPADEKPSGKDGGEEKSSGKSKEKPVISIVAAGSEGDEEQDPAAVPVEKKKVQPTAEFAKPKKGKAAKGSKTAKFKAPPSPTKGKAKDKAKGKEAEKAAVDAAPAEPAPPPPPAVPLTPITPRNP